jgi:hypothetical protein
MRSLSIKRIFVLALAFALVALAGAASSASATFHLMKIRSIFRGPNDPTGAFIELQMYADGQNQLSGHNLNLWNFDMSAGTGITLNTNVPIGQNQRMVLIRDAGSALPADYKANLGTFLTNNASGGLACWETVDCVAWGNFSGMSPPSPVGTPIVGGLSGSMVSVRRIDRGCPTALDAADDTGDSNSDFGFAVGYSVRDNSVAPTETPCAPSTGGGPVGTSPMPGSSPQGALPAKKKCKKHKHRSAAVAKKCKKHK